MATFTIKLKNVIELTGGTLTVGEDGISRNVEVQGKCNSVIVACCNVNPKDIPPPMISRFFSCEISSGSVRKDGLGPMEKSARAYRIAS